MYSVIQCRPISRRLGVVEPSPTARLLVVLRHAVEVGHGGLSEVGGVHVGENLEPASDVPVLRVTRVLRSIAFALTRCRGAAREVQVDI